MAFIDDIFALDAIFNIEHEVEQKYGIPITNVSYWDSSIAFQKHMAKELILPSPSLPWNYYYTYSISTKDQQQILKNFGIPMQNIQSTMGLLLQSSTIAIVNMINLLVHYKRKKLCILQPAYFSVASCCNMLSLDYDVEQLMYINKYPRIPIDKIKSGGYDCVWITSPVYCTSYYPNDDFIKDILYLKQIGMSLVFDESLALPGKELIRLFPIDLKLFAIYSPHKAISINGIKFAIIVCNKFYEDFLEQWVDVFSGALSGTNRDAIFHYISPNYLNNCYPAYEAYINHNKKNISNIIAQYSFASMLPNTDGHYINIFINIEISNINEILTLMNDIIYTSFVSFIPSMLNGFNLNQGFGFRINLTGDCSELITAVGKIMKYLNDHF